MIQTIAARLRRGVTRLLTEESSPDRLALAFAAGAFIGPTPTVGLHTVSAIGLAQLLRLNKVVAVIGSNLANPWTMPFFLWLDVKVGAAIIGRQVPAYPGRLSAPELWDWVQPMIAPAFVGCVPVGLALALVSGGVVYGLARLHARRP